MRKRISYFFKGEAFKMRDVAFGPTIAIVSAFPVVLVIIVAVIAIYAISKIVKISRDKKDKEK